MTKHCYVSLGYGNFPPSLHSVNNMVLVTVNPLKVYEPWEPLSEVLFEHGSVPMKAKGGDTARAIFRIFITFWISIWNHFSSCLYMQIDDWKWGMMFFFLWSMEFVDRAQREWDGVSEYWCLWSSFIGTRKIQDSEHFPTHSILIYSSFSWNTPRLAMRTHFMLLQLAFDGHGFMPQKR